MTGFEVAVDDAGLAYHAPSQLHTTMDMDLVPIDGQTHEDALEQLRADGRPYIKACGICYPETKMNGYQPSFQTATELMGDD